VAKAVADELEALRNAPKGHRNNQLNTSAFNLGQLVGGGELAEAAAEAQLWEAARATGLPDVEIGKTLRSGLEDGIKQPRTAPEPTPAFVPPTVHLMENDDEGEAEAPPSSWRPIDLTAVLDGTWQPPQPTIGQRSDGRGLFYPGKTHTVVSETEAGKSWLALAVAKTEMAAGRHVFYIDFEDDQGTTVGRLRNLGVDREVIRTQFHYFRPEHALEGAHFVALCEELAAHSPSTALLDGVTEAMTLHGLNPLDNVDIAIFNRRVQVPLTAGDAAQISFDHVVKDKDNRGRYALGGVHKLNIVSGAGYTLENLTPFGIGRTGRSRLKVAKDRLGQVRATAVDGSWYGDLVLAGDPDGSADVSIESPADRIAERDEKPFRPTGLMERVSKYLETSDARQSQNRIIGGVSGKRDYVIAALRALIVEGYVSDETPHESLKPYRESDEE
jgi:hypothetical protein